jgi:hypothetical protein
MKHHKLTTALIAVGAVSLASAARADEKAMNAVQAAVAGTTISGYVDTSAQWNFGTGNANNPPYAFGGASKADGFNLNVVDVALDKPQDESPWAAGYHVELWLGPDANTLGSQSTTAAGAGDFAIRQAYVALRTPIGNGINWKIGVFDTIIGYEGLTSPNNPNYTHSYGFTLEPTTHTGILGTYQVNDQVSVSAGVANSFGAAINGRAVSPFGGAPNESFKTYMASVTLTCPTNWGWASGSTVSAGVINGFNANDGEGNPVRQTSVYAGATLSTPITALKLGASLDYLQVHDAVAINGEGDGSAYAAALYASYQATEKLALNLRGEYVYTKAEALEGSGDVDSLDNNRILAFTATAQYDLWKNVVSRLEFRWDHVEHSQAFGGNTAGSPNRDNALMLAANIIYKF